MSEKSWVGLELCYFCHEGKGVLLHRRMVKKFPLQGAVYNQEPCDKCAEHMKDGIILISVRDGEGGQNPYRTGGWVVIKKEAFARIFGDSSIGEAAANKGAAFIENEAWNKLGLPALPEQGGT